MDDGRQTIDDGRQSFIHNVLINRISAFIEAFIT